ncbi:hypothetical protein K090096B2_19750 [Bacteroides fragilis]
MQVADNQLNEFLSANPNLRRVYAYPEWDNAHVITDRQDTVTYYVPVTDETKDTCSYLIVSRASNDVYLYAIKLPIDYSGFDSFLRQDSKILRVIDGSDMHYVGYLHNIPDSILANTRSLSCSAGRGDDNRKRGNIKLVKCNESPNDGLELPEVTVIGKRPDPWENPWKNPWEKPKIDFPRIPPGIGDVFAPIGGWPQPKPTVVLPKIEEMIKNATVKKALEEAWSDMLKRSTKTQRQEVGFWIYYDPVKKQYYIGKKRYGMIVKNDGKARGNISLGDKSPSVNGVPITAKVVASFHTHTSFSEIKGMKRPAGPSKADMVNADKNKLPIIVYDYVGEKSQEDGVYYVIGGHSPDADRKIYTYTPKK